MTPFLDELKRRKVVRAGLVYAASAFVVAQVADIFFPGLGLPGWSLRLVLVLLILGFPVTLALAWAYDLTNEGLVRTKGPLHGRHGPDAAATERNRARRAAGWLGAGLTVVLSAAAAWYVVPGRQAAPHSDADSLTAVAVFPFSVRGSPNVDYLGDGMVDLLSAKLDGAGTLRAVDPRALLGFLQRHGGRTTDPERGRAVAQHFGAGLYILGNILEVGGRLQLSASLYRADLDSTPSSARVEGEAERIWELVDQLAAQLLAGQLGRGSRLTRLAATTTTSFPALRAYLEGESALRVGNFQAALDAFHRAAAADSTFALAHYRLAVAAAWAFDAGLSTSAIARAVRHAERLSARDRRLVAAFQLYQEGRATQAEPIYRALVATYPDDIEAWYQLGEVLIHHNAFRGRSWEEAREAFARATALEPDHELSITHLLLLEVGQGRAAEAAALLARLDRDGILHNGYAPVVWLLGNAADRARAIAAFRTVEQPILEVVAWLAQVGSGTHDVAADVARLLTEPSRSLTERSAGHRLLAQIHMGQGRRRAAGEALLAAEALDPVPAVQHRALLSLSPLHRPPRAQLEALHAALEAPARGHAESRADPVGVEDAMREQLRLYLLGLVSAAIGGEGDAMQYAAELERSEVMEAWGTIVQDLSLAVRADAARERGEAAEALALLERARLEVAYVVAIGSPFLFMDRERFLRAELLSQLGREDQAIGWYTAVTETSIAYSALAHLRLGELHDRLGDAVTAAQHYSHFTAVWQDCDPEFQPLRDHAERRLVALLGEAPSSAASRR